MSEPPFTALAIVGGDGRAPDLHAPTTVLSFFLRDHDGDRDLELLLSAIEAGSIDIVVLLVAELEAHEVDAVITAFAATTARITIEIVNSSCSIALAQLEALVTSARASLPRLSNMPRLTTLTSQIA